MSFGGVHRLKKPKKAKKSAGCAADDDMGAILRCNSQSKKCDSHGMVTNWEITHRDFPLCIAEVQHKKTPEPLCDKASGAFKQNLNKASD
ncbi:hypothetical protein [Pandoraea sputorum]|uniref:hypothetical protein n=1 Tax=Pandoraea sputorum TaxID=93222 RepID=UPI000AEEA8B3|nr:hypothetical protein [Pandoraea sputorum]